MHGRRVTPIRRLVAALVVALIGLIGPGSGANPGTALGSSHWTGGVDLYRSGAFTTQKTWLWCTAADVQIVRNLVDRQADHTRSGQQRYFDAMRVHNRYNIPVSDGVDPAGWTYGLRHFVDARYRLVASGSFSTALRSAVTNLRKTNLPVGITVSHGNHAWILTGFTATADPAVTTRFTVTSVHVVGPLWGLQSRSYGYDMRPDMKLTPRQFAGFFTPWHYARIRMAWEGRWVSIQPIPAAISSTASIASTAPTAPTTSILTPTRMSPPRATAAGIPAPSATASVDGASSAGSTPVAVAVAADPGHPRGTANPPNLDAAAGDSSRANAPAWIAAFLAIVAIVALSGFVLAIRGAQRRRTG